MAKDYLTKQGAEKFRHEYQQLFHVERPKIVETVAWAAGNGDRSENGDYIYGKQRLREIDRRLRFIRQKLEDAEVVDTDQLQSPVVVFGAWVEVETEAGQLKQYRIVGDDEIDPRQGWISWRSPVAKSLLGKSPGDEVIIQKPSGEESLVIQRFWFKAG